MKLSDFKGEEAVDVLASLMTPAVAIASDKDSIVLDFFSGSASMAHAVLQKNVDDAGKRKFIMVQIPETTSSPEYPTLCDIGKERIRRAGAKIKEESPLTTQDLDIGFRVFKLDDSNMNDVYYAAGDYTQDLLTMLESNVKSDRTDLDLLFGCLLEWSLPLSMPYKSEKIEGYTIHTYNDGDLIACFDDNVTEDVITEIAKKKPHYFVMRDSSMASDSVAANFEQIFATYSPGTVRRVM